MFTETVELKSDETTEKSEELETPYVELETDVESEELSAPKESRYMRPKLKRTVEIVE